MIAIYSLIIVISVSTTYIKFNTILKPNVLITSIWAILASLSALGLNGFNKPGIYTHLYCISFIGIFNIVYLILTNRNSMKKICISEIENSYRYKLIYILNFLSWIYMIPILFNALHIISNYGFLAIREYTFTTSDVLVNASQKFISQIIIKSIFQSTVLLAMVNIALNRKTRLLTLISVINVAIYTVTFGGRFEILQILVYYILANILLKKIKFTKKKKKISLAFIFITVVGMSIITAARGSGNFFNSIYTYYVTPFVFLDYIINNPDIFHLNNYLFGSATFGFISEPITLILKVLFNADLDIASYYINICSQPFYNLGSGKYFNALTTAIYPFIRDFGYIGIILGGGFLATLISTFENKFGKTKKILYYCLYIFLTYVAINSVLIYELLSYGSTFVIFFIWLFTSGKKVKNMEDKI